MKRGKDNTSRVVMTMTQSSGTWLNGSLQKQMYFVSLELKDPNGKPVARASLTFEQASRMLLYNGEVECTLTRYRGEDGKMLEEKVEAPETIHKRMTDRLDDTMTTLKKRLFDIEKDLYDMVNGDKKRSKTAIKEMLQEVKVVKEHLIANEAFVVQQAEEELGEMQSNVAGQLGLYIQSHTGGELPASETLTKLLSTGGENQVLAIPDKRIVPKIDDYELKTRAKKPIDDMTSLQVADAMHKRLKQIERAEGDNGSGPDGNKQLFFAKAMEIKGQKVAVNYINYQGSHNMELDKAKRYLKFLLSIKTVDEFKAHWHFDE